MKAIDYLRSKEWSMGCNGRINKGQCPECCGLHEGHFPSIHALDSSKVGHKPDCALAAAISDLGGEPLYLGESKLDGKYRCRGMKLVSADTPLDEHELAERERFRKVFEPFVQKMCEATERWLARTEDA